jgi:hypothetical protein
MVDSFDSSVTWDLQRDRPVELELLAFVKARELGVVESVIKE